MLASEIASPGGASTTTKSYCAEAVAINDRITSEAMSCPGEGAAGPLVMRNKVGAALVTCTHSSSVAVPVRKLLKPLRLDTPNRRCWVGRRKSTSTSSTRASLCASTQARFAHTVDLPSLGMALVNITLRGG